MWGWGGGGGSASTRPCWCGRANGVRREGSEERDRTGGGVEEGEGAAGTGRECASGGGGTRGTEGESRSGVGNRAGGPAIRPRRPSRLKGPSGFGRVPLRSGRPPPPRRARPPAGARASRGGGAPATTRQAADWPPWRVGEPDAWGGAAGRRHPRCVRRSSRHPFPCRTLLASHRRCPTAGARVREGGARSVWQPVGP